MESAGSEHDLAELWAVSGCQALTDPGADVPGRLVAGVAELVSALDAHGAGLAATYGAAGLGLLAERAAALMLPRSGSRSCGGASRLLEVSGGWLAVTLARLDDRALLPAWLGVAADAACVLSNADPWAEVERRLVGRSVGESVETAALLGVACSGVGERAPNGSPVVVERIGTVRPRPLVGLRVVNLASLWAGPLCAEVMLRLGADVVCVESTGRPDGARATPGWFDALHAGQRSVALDFRSPADVDRLWHLLHAADVVIEGSRPRALRQLGIVAEDVVADGPRAWVSITAHGRAPEHAMRVGYGDDAAAAGGLVGWVDGRPVFLADAVADPVSGLVAALAIVDTVTAGDRAIIDVALAGVAAAYATRRGDAVVSRLRDAAEPRSPRLQSDRFVLGAETEAVMAEWISDL